MTATYAVVGAGGRTGEEVVNRLLVAQPKANVRAVVRTPSKYQDVFPQDPRLSIVAGDVTDAASLKSALEGCQGVIFTASSSGYWQADAVDHKGVANTATAAREAGCGQVVLVSSQLVSPHQRWHPIRMLLNTARWGLMDRKLEGEAALRRSGVPYTIVRPSGLSNAPGGCAKLLAGQGDKGVAGAGAAISRADVAAVCVAALNHPAARNVTLEIGAAKEPISAGAYDDQLGRLFEGLKPDTM